MDFAHAYAVSTLSSSKYDLSYRKCLFLNMVKTKLI